MNQLIDWIDKSLADISASKLFSFFFSKEKLRKEFEDIDVFYLLNETKGIDVIFSDKLFITAIHLYSGRYLEMNKFEGNLPSKIDFSFSRIKVRQLLGLPDITSGDHMISTLGHNHYWDKYLYDTYSIHLQYDKTQKYIELLTIESLSFGDDDLPE